jgi:hypothetical protein
MKNWKLPVAGLLVALLGPVNAEDLTLDAAIGGATGAESGGRDGRVPA